jgi:predicted enzyme related to lactoylglutathione lyase
MSSPIVFIDIAEQSQARIAVNTPLGVAIRKDPAEKRIYIGVDDIKETLSQIEACGGSVDVPRFEVSGVVVLGLSKDPAGNEMGLVEIENGVPKVP